jgi:hypothetical protein
MNNEKQVGSIVQLTETGGMVPTVNEPIPPPVIKRGRGRPRKAPVEYTHPGLAPVERTTDKDKLREGNAWLSIFCAYITNASAPIRTPPEIIAGLTDKALAEYKKRFGPED